MIDIIVLHLFIGKFVNGSVKVGLQSEHFEIGFSKYLYQLDSEVEYNKQ